MTKRTLALATLAVSLVAAASLTVDGEALAGKLRIRKGTKPRAHANVAKTYCRSSVYTGNIGDYVTVGRKRFRVGDETTIYVLGKGLTERGVFVTRAPVYVSGVVKNGVPTATMIIVGRSESLAGARTVSNADGTSPSVGLAARGGPR